MGTISGDYIISRVQQTLIDTTGAAWNVANIVKPAFLSALRSLSNGKPNVYSITQIMTFVNGSMQTVPAGMKAFSALICNVAPDGVTIGPGCITQSRGVWTQQDPMWPTYTPNATTRVALCDANLPKTFWTIPAQIAGNKGMVMGSAIPTMSDTSQPIPVDDNYEDILYWYTLAHCFEKNTKQGDLIKSKDYFALADQATKLAVAGEQQVIARAD